MALNKPELASTLKASLLELFEYMRTAAKNDPDAVTEEFYAEEFGKIIANDVIDHIVSNGVVTLNITNPAYDAMNPLTNPAAVPAPGDGGLVLQQAFNAYMVTIDPSTGRGTIS